MTNSGPPYCDRYGVRFRRLRVAFSRATSAAVFVAACYCTSVSFAQEPQLELTVDTATSGVPLPNIFTPSIDVSGRGAHAEISWPQGASSKVTLDDWRETIGFKGVYRLQYNLWEIYQFSKNKNLQADLLANYEYIIKTISDWGGIVLLNIFSTPPGMGTALDKKSTPWDLKAFKAVIKQTMRHLSCERRYNVWYEVWSAPDIDEFYLGRKSEYLQLYRSVAESARELEAEYKLQIPVGGPSTSWWFQNLDGNNITTPERSLVYELIKFCYSYRLPLDFISWHGYSTDPRVEKEITRYKKTSVALVRDWLSYFRRDPTVVSLIVDEWNYDDGENLIPERQERSHVAASYLLARLKQMYSERLDYQAYYCLEDFQNNKEGVARNTGVFWYDRTGAEYKRGAKVIISAFKMLTLLDDELLPVEVKPRDEFVDAIVSKAKDSVSVIAYNYADPAIGMNHLSRSFGGLRDADRKIALTLHKSGKLKRAIENDPSLGKLRLPKRLNNAVKKAQELQARLVSYGPRALKLVIKNLKGDYVYRRYVIDGDCALNCPFAPVEEKDILSQSVYEETLTLAPYSVVMVTLEMKPPQQVVPAPPAVAEPLAETVVIPQPSVAPEAAVAIQPATTTPEVTAKPAPVAPTDQDAPKPEGAQSVSQEGS